MFGSGLMYMTYLRKLHIKRHLMKTYYYYYYIIIINSEYRDFLA
jgi:hypothetical protein